jgi:hypothetical protein
MEMHLERVDRENEVIAGSDAELTSMSNVLLTGVVACKKIPLHIFFVNNRSKTGFCESVSKLPSRKESLFERRFANLLGSWRMPTTSDFGFL